MTHIEEARVAAVIQTIAAKENKAPGEIRQAMQGALDDAWAAAWAPGNIHAQAQWQRLFPGGRKPTVEEFVAVTSNYVTAHR